MRGKRSARGVPDALNIIEGGLRGIDETVRQKSLGRAAQQDVTYMSRSHNQSLHVDKIRQTPAPKA